MNNSFHKVLVNTAQTIRDALKAINADLTLKLAIVVDDDGLLQGVVTDGDIRRALLTDYSLDSSVVEIMNTSPVVATPDTAKSVLVSMMDEKGIGAIPIISDGVLVGVGTYHDASISKEYENPVFLMAGGFGSRLRPLTDNCPKPLLDVGGKPLLETVLLNFKRAGFKNFYISTHYLPEMIRAHFGHGEKWGVNITYVHEDSPLGTGGALGLLPDTIPNLPVLMMNGDVLTNVDFEHLLEFHNSNQATATMCVREYDYQIPYGVITGDGNKMVAIDEKPLHSFFVNAGIYVIDNSIVRSIAKNQCVDMPSLLEQQVGADRDVLLFPIHEYWLDIGRIDDFKKAQMDFATLGFKHE